MPLIVPNYIIDSKSQPQNEPTCTRCDLVDETEEHIFATRPQKRGGTLQQTSSTDSYPEFFNTPARANLSASEDIRAELSSTLYCTQGMNPFIARTTNSHTYNSFLILFLSPSVRNLNVRAYPQVFFGSLADLTYESTSSLCNVYL